ncbi:hypothetical protein [Marinobacter salicampi]|nr:hypothetical protein [Marinobacter salicampi]
MKAVNRPPGHPARTLPGTAGVPHHLMDQIHNENAVYGRTDSRMGRNNHG